MGNLGKYQDIVTEAKRSGGVDMFVAAIEKAAVEKAVPKAFGAGVAVTMVATLGVAAITKRLSAHAKTRDARADEAKAQLGKVLSQEVSVDGEVDAVEGEDKSLHNIALDESGEDGSDYDCPHL